jgi:hypothetical protein
LLDTERPVEPALEVVVPLPAEVAGWDPALCDGDPAEPSDAGDDEPGTGPNAGGSGRTGTVRGIVIDGVLTEGGVTPGVRTCGVVTGPTVTDGTVTGETVTVGTVTEGTDTDGTDTVGRPAEADGTLTPTAVSTATDSAPHTMRTIRRQRLTD